MHENGGIPRACIPRNLPLGVVGPKLHCGVLNVPMAHDFPFPVRRREFAAFDCDGDGADRLGLTAARELRLGRGGGLQLVTQFPGFAGQALELVQTVGFFGKCHLLADVFGPEFQ